MKTDSIMVSVIVITYNHEKYLRQALNSILMQEVNFKYEVIIGEDCSPDDSRLILKEYESNYPDIFKVIYRDHNIGANNNLFDLFLKSKGKYIAFLEGDDYWTDKHKLKEQVEFLENNIEYSGVFHNVTVSDEKGNEVNCIPNDQFVLENKIDTISSIEEFIGLFYKTMGQVFHIQSLVYRNMYCSIEDVDTVKILITSAKYVGDTPIKLLVAKYGELKYIDKNMGNYRLINKEGNTSFSSQNILIHYKDILSVWKGVNIYFNYKYDNLIKKIILKEKCLVIFEILKNRDMKNSFKIFMYELSLYEKIQFINSLNKKVFDKVLNLNKK